MTIRNHDGHEEAGRKWQHRWVCNVCKVPAIVKEIRQPHKLHSAILSQALICAQLLGGGRWGFVDSLFFTS